MSVRFRIGARDGEARTGVLETAHGAVPTPAFMPVGTAGSVKAMRPGEVRESGAAIVLGNVYHLMLRPGAERIAGLGGLGRFMGWDGPVLTDSGGYQVMSAGERAEVDADGVTFRSHLDGTPHRLTPARSVEIQRLLDATVTMAFDECTPWPADEATARASMERSMVWAERSREAYGPREGHAIFGIMQGGMHEGLRRRSAARLLDIGFDGYAAGGLGVGEDREELLRIVRFAAPLLPEDRPRYLMGIGRPADILDAVRAGFDLFDCVLPTRHGRTGQAFTARGRVNIRNARHAADPGPLDPGCPCPACAAGHSRAYLHHLEKAGEVLGMMLLTQHNLWFYQRLMREIREAVAAGTLAELRERRIAAEEGAPG